MAKLDLELAQFLLIGLALHFSVLGLVLVLLWRHVKVPPVCKFLAYDSHVPTALGDWPCRLIGNRANAATSIQHRERMLCDHQLFIRRNDIDADATSVVRD